MVRAYDDNGNVVDLVAWEKQIRADAIDLVEQLKNKYESFTHEEYYVSAMVSDLEDLLEQLKGAEEWMIYKWH